MGFISEIANELFHYLLPLNLFISCKAPLSSSAICIIFQKCQTWGAAVGRSDVSDSNSHASGDTTSLCQHPSGGNHRKSCCRNCTSVGGSTGTLGRTSAKTPGRPHSDRHLHEQSHPWRPFCCYCKRACLRTADFLQPLSAPGLGIILFLGSEEESTHFRTRVHYYCCCCCPVHVDEFG